MSESVATQFYDKVCLLNISTIARVKVEHFKLTPGSNEDYYYENFLHACYTRAAKRSSLSPTAHGKTFIKTLQRYMPYWTPPAKDNIVYATICIDEALSGNIADIEAYLIKLKKELHIGEERYPSKIIIAGDQQT